MFFFKTTISFCLEWTWLIFCVTLLSKPHACQFFVIKFWSKMFQANQTARLSFLQDLLNWRKKLGFLFRMGAASFFPKCLQNFEINLEMGLVVLKIDVNDRLEYVESTKIKKGILYCYTTHSQSNFSIHLSAVFPLLIINFFFVDRY